MENLKEKAARRALDFVESGMRIGLGSGSTNAYFLEMLGEAVQAGRLRDIRAVPTSQKTAQRARQLGIALTTLSVLHREVESGLADLPLLDLCVDGADEVDPDLNLIKGLGKALLREKIVEIHAQRFVVVVDQSKMSPRLGMHSPLPVEIVQFEADLHVRWLGALCGRSELWLDETSSPYVTDNGNYLARCFFTEGIHDLFALDETLARRPGIVEHGLFLGMATEVIVAGEDGVRMMERVR